MPPFISFISEYVSFLIRPSTDNRDMCVITGLKRTYTCAADRTQTEKMYSDIQNGIVILI